MDNIEPTLTPVPIPGGAFKKCWPEQHCFVVWFCGAGLIVLLAGLAYRLPDYAYAWRTCALFGLGGAARCEYVYVRALVKRAISGSASFDFRSLGYSGEARNAGMVLGMDKRHPSYFFICIVAMIVVTAASFIFVTSVHDYLSPLRSSEWKCQNPEIRNLIECRCDDSIGWRAARLASASVYFSTVTLATIGFGDVSPGFTLWGRLAVFIMTMYLFFVLPFLIQYILGATAFFHADDSAKSAVGQARGG